MKPSCQRGQPKQVVGHEFRQRDNRQRNQYQQQQKEKRVLAPRSVLSRQSDAPVNRRPRTAATTAYTRPVEFTGSIRGISCQGHRLSVENPQTSGSARCSTDIEVAEVMAIYRTRSGFRAGVGTSLRPVGTGTEMRHP